MPVEGRLLSTWASLHREHGEIFVKINLLEKALVAMLQKNVAAPKENALVQQRDFLEAFKQGVVLHFAVEKEALFPEIAKIGKKEKTLMDELLFEHGSIMEKYLTIIQSPYGDEEKTETLLKMAQELEMHAQKEERDAYPLVKKLSPAQLEMVDQGAKRLGYRI